MSEVADQISSTSAVTVSPLLAPTPQKGVNIQRGGQSAGRIGQIVSATNRWRENYNPLRRLTMRRVVELLELGQRGDTAYLQWAYEFIERRNPTLSGLVSRCEAPLANFEWSVKIKATLPPGATPAMAEAQKQTLTTAYEVIDNLRAALLHLHSAEFRGYAHVQKHRNPDGSIYHLEPLHQWCVCRDGLEGNWFWNPDSISTSQPLQNLGIGFAIGGPALPLQDFIIRTVPRPVDEIGIVDTVRRGLCEKNADAFIEIYGVPGGVVIMPPEVPQGQEPTYAATAQSISEGAPGALPSGSSYIPNSGPRNVDPFTPRLAHLDEALVLAGTGGKLSMLTEKRSGTRGNSKMHGDTFLEIASGRARGLAEVLQQQIDAEVLQQQHAGEPVCCYFDFGAADEDDITSLINNAVALSAAGYKPDRAWLAEQTGYVLGDPPAPPPAPALNPLMMMHAAARMGGAATPPAPEDPAAPASAPEPVKNRAPGVADPGAVDPGVPPSIADTLHEVLLPLLKRLEAIAAVPDAGIQQHMLTKLMSDMPSIAAAIQADDSLAKKLSPILAGQMIAAIQAPVATADNTQP